jgi:hypothetical protein
LKEKGGYPWTTLPDFMFEHAGQGYAGHGTLCGALGVSSCLINLVIYDKEHTYSAIIDRLFWWYAQMQFPTERFDAISKFPNQVKAQAMTPLCHSSVSKWTLTAGTEVSSDEKYERCAKVAGEVVYTVTYYLNEYFEGRWKPGKWTPSKEITHCIECHGPESYGQYTNGMNQQQGHMECLLCHKDHMKALLKRRTMR